MVKLPRMQKLEVDPDLRPDSTEFHRRKSAGPRRVMAGPLLSGSVGLTRAECEPETRNIRVGVQVGFDGGWERGRVSCCEALVLRVCERKIII